jgi:hypothetical protein
VGRAQEPLGALAAEEPIVHEAADLLGLFR